MSNKAGHLALLACAILVLGACARVTTSEAPSPSLEASPSAAAESPSPGPSPSPIASPVVARLTISRLPFHLGEVGIGYLAVALSAAGGVPPYSWTIGSGTFPPGLALSTSGIASGKPTKAATFTFSVRVTDSAGAVANGASSIFVFKPLAFTTTSATCNLDPGPPCTITLNYTGGASSAAPRLAVKVNSGDPPLPPGSTFKAKGGVVTIFINYQCNSISTAASLVLSDPSPLCSTGFKCSSGPAKVTVIKTFSC